MCRFIDREGEDCVFKVSGFQQKSSLVNELAKILRGMGFYFLLGSTKQMEKTPLLEGLSPDTPVTVTIHTIFHDSRMEITISGLTHFRRQMEHPPWWNTSQLTFLRGF